MQSVSKQAKIGKRDTKKRISSLYSLTKKLKTDVDNAYRERNLLVLFLTKLYPSFRGLHEEDPKWGSEWMNIIYIETPAGQLSWHIHDRELPMFEHLELRTEKDLWDGHDTEEKYRRLASLDPVLE